MTISYTVYGKQRDTGPVSTDFAKQKQDGSGLVYMNARYYGEPDEI